MSESTPAFIPGKGYTREQIEQASGYRPVDVLKHLGGGYISVNDMIGEYAQYDFSLGHDGLYHLFQIDGERVHPTPGPGRTPITASEFDKGGNLHTPSRELYRRRPAVISAERIETAGTLETQAGTFAYKPGDMLCYSELRVWVVEGDVFSQLYEAVAD